MSRAVAGPTVAGPTVAGPTVAGAPDADATVRIPLQRPSEDPTVAIPTMAPSRSGRPGGRWRAWRRGLILALVVLLFASLALIGALNGSIPLSFVDGNPPSNKPARIWSQTVVQDALASGRLWRSRVDKPNQATCTPVDKSMTYGLVVQLQKVGLYRCPGPTNLLGDFTMSVDVHLMTPGSCAGVWFRYTQMSGYVLRVCADGYYLNTHGRPGSSDVVTMRTMIFDRPAAAKDVIRVGITMEGDAITLYRDGKQVGGVVHDPTFPRGGVLLGILQGASLHERPPFTVMYKDIEIRE